MRQVFENITEIIANHFNKVNNFDILKYPSIVSILNSMYGCFILEGIEKIENLSYELKVKYYAISKQYYAEKEEQIKASKAAYVISLITAND